MVIVTSSVDEKLSVTADSGMSRNAAQRWAGAGAWSPECGSGSGDGIRGEQVMTWRAETRHNYEMVYCPEILDTSEASRDMIG